MVNRISHLVRGPAAVVAVLCLTACAAEEAEFGGATMGTTWSVKVVDSPVPPERLRASLAATLEQVNTLMSTYDPDSELMRFNAAPMRTPFVISTQTGEVIRLAQTIARATEGAFDVTVGPLVNLWGFGPRQQPVEVPTPDAIADARARVGFGRLHLRDGTLLKDAPLFVDLSAIAKGHAVDELASVLAEAGVGRFLVEVGGELRAAGLNASGRPWRVAIEAPKADTREIYRVVELRGMGLATSGDYRNYFETDVRRYSHMIDPRTGAPIAHRVASVSVLHTSVAEADGWATALNVLGLEDGMMIATREGLRAMFIIRDGDAFAAHASPAFEAYVRQSDQRAGANRSD